MRRRDRFLVTGANGTVGPRLPLLVKQDGFDLVEVCPGCRGSFFEMVWPVASAHAPVAGLGDDAEHQVPGGDCAAVVGRCELSEAEDHLGSYCQRILSLGLGPGSSKSWVRKTFSVMPTLASVADRSSAA